MSTPEARQVRVLVLETGGRVRCEFVPDRLESFQALVGGSVEHVHLPLGLHLYCNEESQLHEMDPNLWSLVLKFPLAGTVVVFREQGGRRVDITPEDERVWQGQLKQRLHNELKWLGLRPASLDFVVTSWPDVPDDLRPGP